MHDSIYDQIKNFYIASELPNIATYLSIYLHSFSPLARAFKAKICSSEMISIIHCRPRGQPPQNIYTALFSFTHVLIWAPEVRVAVDEITGVVGGGGVRPNQATNRTAPYSYSTLSFQTSKWSQASLSPPSLSLFALPGYAAAGNDGRTVAFVRSLALLCCSRRRRRRRRRTECISGWERRTCWLSDRTTLAPSVSATFLFLPF